MLRIILAAFLLYFATSSARIIRRPSTDRFVDALLQRELQPELKDATLDPVRVQDEVKFVNTTPFYGGPLNITMYFTNSSIAGLSSVFRSERCTPPKVSPGNNIIFNCTIVFPRISTYYNINVTRNSSSLAPSSFRSHTKLSNTYAVMEIASNLETNATSLINFDVLNIGRTNVRCKFSRICRIPQAEERAIQNKTLDDLTRVLNSSFKEALERSVAKSKSNIFPPTKSSKAVGQM